MVLLGAKSLGSKFISKYAELFAGPAPSASPNSPPCQQVNACEQKDDSWCPKPLEMERNENRSYHQNSDRDESASVLLNHLSATSLANHK
jgi:hypothetical protein